MRRQGPTAEQPVPALAAYKPVAHTHCHHQLPLQLAFHRRRQHPHLRARPIPGRGRIRRPALLRPLSGLGDRRVNDRLPIASDALEFDRSNWSLEAIQSRFRAAVDQFGPDFVIVADSWNMKPILAEAIQHYPYFLRFQAQECLCPLNNLRLLALRPDDVEQCPRNQLATPAICRSCVIDRGPSPGTLHQWERALAQVGTAEYDQRLRRSLEKC